MSYENVKSIIWKDEFPVINLTVVWMNFATIRRHIDRICRVRVLQNNERIVWRYDRDDSY